MRPALFVCARAELPCQDRSWFSSSIQRTGRTEEPRGYVSAFQRHSEIWAEFNCSTLLFPNFQVFSGSCSSCGSGKPGPPSLSAWPVVGVGLGSSPPFSPLKSPTEQSPQQKAPALVGLLCGDDDGACIYANCLAYRSSGSSSQLLPQSRPLRVTQ